jgi:predicted NBD/HSP70 family sugar kinase
LGATTKSRIGIDLGGTKIEGIVLTADGSVTQRVRLPTPSEDYDSTLETIAAIVSQLELQAGRCSVGVGTPGAISPTTARMKNANSTCLNGNPLQQDLERRLDRPIRIANDANCFALSEAVDGSGSGANVVFGVILGTGVGGGLVVNRRVIVGANAIAGEWGHNLLDPLTPNEALPPRCYCGRQGCVESWLSGPALSRDHEAVTGERLTAEELHSALLAGDAAAGRSLERYADRLARALSSVINIVDPDIIVFGGGLSRIKSLYELIPQKWGATIFSDSVDTQLLPPTHGDAGGARGAAWLWGAEEDE